MSYTLRSLVLNNSNNDSNANNRNNLNNNTRFVRITQALEAIIMEDHSLYSEICSHENLEVAYNKAKKGKTVKNYVIQFERNLSEKLLQLRNELLFHTYNPKPLQTFILKDPKTRRINKSEFRDRIVHHALCNIIEPIFDKIFIYDSYANRKGKGTLKAIQRFDFFKRKISKNNTKPCFVLKADVRHYFDEVDHDILIKIVRTKIKDERTIWLIKKILENYTFNKQGKSMPLGNLTSQFFANVYLNELDQFVKHHLKVKYYIRYVDDFVIFENDAAKLERYTVLINEFLLQILKIELHPDKSKVLCLQHGISFLGFRIFYYHKLLRKTNIRKRKQISKYFIENKKDTGYDEVYESFQGWNAYAMHANTYKLRMYFTNIIEHNYPNEIASTELNRLIKTIQQTSTTY